VSGGFPDQQALSQMFTETNGIITLAQSTGHESIISREISSRSGSLLALALSPGELYLVKTSTNLLSRIIWLVQSTTLTPADIVKHRPQHLATNPSHCSSM
jgi:hypothetical protein